MLIMWKEVSVLGRDRFYLVKHHFDSTKKFSATDIFNMLEFLIDNIFVMFGGRAFQQTETLLLFSPRPICICGILYFKLNGIDAINKITKPRII
jgi:hypothetical protein